MLKMRSSANTPAPAPAGGSRSRKSYTKFALNHRVLSKIDTSSSSSTSSSGSGGGSLLQGRQTWTSLGARDAANRSHAAAREAVTGRDISSRPTANLSIAGAAYAVMAASTESGEESSSRKMKSGTFVQTRRHRLDRTLVRAAVAVECRPARMVTRRSSERPLMRSRPEAVREDSIIRVCGGGRRSREGVRGGRQSWKGVRRRDYLGKKRRDVCYLLFFYYMFY